MLASLCTDFDAFWSTILKFDLSSVFLNVKQSAIHRHQFKAEIEALCSAVFLLFLKKKKRVRGSTQVPHPVRVLRLQTCTETGYMAKTNPTYHAPRAALRGSGLVQSSVASREGAGTRIIDTLYNAHTRMYVPTSEEKNMKNAWPSYRTLYGAHCEPALQSRWRRPHLLY